MTLEQRTAAAAEELTRHIPLERVGGLLAQRILVAAGVPDLQARCDIYRRALERIADAESGVWGRWAHDALSEAER